MSVDPLAVVVGLALVLVALMASVGLLHFTRGNPIERIRILDGGELPAVGEGYFCEIVETLVNTDLEEGNRIEVLFDGDEVYPRLWRDLEAARTLVTWHVFWFKPGELADRVWEILVERARAGVRVLFLYFVPDDDFRRFLVQAVERGVDVRVLTPGDLSGGRRPVGPEAAEATTTPGPPRRPSGRPRWPSGPS